MNSTMLSTIFQISDDSPAYYLRNYIEHEPLATILIVAMIVYMLFVNSHLQDMYETFDNLQCSINSLHKNVDHLKNQVTTNSNRYNHFIARVDRTIRALSSDIQDIEKNLKSMVVLFDKHSELIQGQEQIVRDTIEPLQRSVYTLETNNCFTDVANILDQSQKVLDSFADITSKHSETVSSLFDKHSNMLQEHEQIVRDMIGPLQLSVTTLQHENTLFSNNITEILNMLMEFSFSYPNINKNPLLKNHRNFLVTNGESLIKCILAKGEPKTTEELATTLKYPLNLMDNFVLSLHNKGIIKVVPTGIPNCCKWVLK